MCNRWAKPLLSTADFTRPATTAFGFGAVDGYAIFCALFCPCTRMVMIDVRAGVKSDTMCHRGTAHYGTNHGDNQFFHF